MMTDSHQTSVAMDPVRLSYCYLDEGDVDAYCSLFAEQAVHRQPGTTPVTGRTELERVERARQTPVRHSIYQVFGAGRQVTAIGLRHLSTHTDVHFIDIFTVADNGLLADRTTYLFTPSAR
jgi:ketosteroid isomerase-like protein